MNRKTEKLAELEHVQWGYWTKHMLAAIRAEIKAMGSVTPEEFDVLDCVQRWSRQIKTNYEELSEQEKQLDREWALQAEKILKEQKG